jgi:acyl-CoA thioesterase-1
MRALILLCLLCWSTLGQAQAPVILVLGDSLSAAYGIAPEQGWVALLRQRLAAENYPHQVVNASISGATSSGGVSRLPDLLEQHQPSLVIIALGGNDGLRGFPPQQLQDNLSRLVTLAQDAKAKVLLCGVRIPPNYGQVYTQRFSAVFAAVAEQHHIALVPKLLADVADDLDFMQADGLHPAAEAQEKVLDNVWQGLEALF